LIRIFLAILVLSVVGCASVATKKLNDGELALPADYKSWSKFLSEVQRPDAKQVRDIYVNPLGHRTAAGGSFPNGTLFVMENYAAKPKADGTLEQGADGKLVKGNLLSVFVMGKGEDWGEGAPADLKNGNWVYTAFKGDGQPSGADTKPCRACHLPIAQKDFVHRYDEYFSKRN
jgi:hypothetical protein